MFNSRPDYREVRRFSNAGISGVEEVKGNFGFEHHNVIFWRIWGWTIGWLYGWWIRRKSIKLAKKVFADRSTVVLNNQEILKEARQSFGPNRVAELFTMRTFGFNYPFSPLMKMFTENAARSPAMDIVYNGLGSFESNGKRIYSTAAKPDLLAYLWLNCPNGQGVRNRGRLISGLYRKLGMGKTLLIAGGSGQSAIDALSYLKKSGKSDGIELVITDVSPDALALARTRAKDSMVEELVQFREVSFVDIAVAFDGQDFDTIEICGICEYLSDEQVVALIKVALQLLKSGGRVLVSSMNETSEAWFLENWWNWPIKYRSPEDMAGLIKLAGGKEPMIYTEPWQIYSVAVTEI